MGQVYRARDVRLDRVVALKVLPPSVAHDVEACQRLEREARTISRLSHPNICTLYDVGRDDDVDFLVMEYLEGETLATRLETGPLSFASLLRCANEISDALDRAHRQGIIHRDLKPSNICLTETGAKLLDFGIAILGGREANTGDDAESASSQLARQARFVGTVAYMSPEQVRGEEIDARSDLFSFGALLHEMATGRRRFQGPNTQTVCAAILMAAPAPDAIDPVTYPGLGRIVQKALRTERDQRYQHASAMRADLQRLELQVDGILHLPDIRFVEVREATDRADPMVVTAGSHQANADVHREFPVFHLNRGAEQTLGVLSIEATFHDVYRRLLARLNRTAVRLSDDERDALTESISLAEQSMTEVRTVSYLLHPPFLDEAGLLSALRWYAGGFAKRSGIKVDLDLPERFERLPLDTETMLFRTVQESLTNIHRHAGSMTARIRLERDAETLVLEIEDRGHGIPDAALKHITSGGGGGVGIASMSERVEQLGGRLDVTSSDHGTTGTTVHVWLPLVKDAG